VASNDVVLARAPVGATVVLDEPDVYMHPDLQRRLLNLVRSRFAQLLVATHSIEMISDVDPGAILSVDRHRGKSAFVTDLPGVQAVIDTLGGTHNIQVTRLFRSRTFVLVEGEDMRILRILQSRLAPTTTPIDLTPYGELGGRGGWTSGLPTKLPNRNADGQKIRSYCLLDRDYFPDEEVVERYEEAKQWGINLKVWTRKELENYLLVPSAISRFVAKKAQGSVTPPSPHEVLAEIDGIIESMKDSPITDGIATVLLSRNKPAGLANASKAARARVAEGWMTQEGRWAIAPGKSVISRLSEWSKASFGVSFGPEQLARELEPSELDPEVCEVLHAIPAGRRFQPPS
jgi:AAA domain, putative AbiEii toxin, Type IV TA system